MRQASFSFLVVLVLAVGCSETPGNTEASKTATGDEPVGFGFTAADIQSTAEVAESMNPLSGDMRNFEAAVQMKNEFRIRPGGVELALRVTLDSGEVPIDEVFVLRPMPQMPSETLAAVHDTGKYVRMYRLATQDRPDMAEAQTKLRDLREDSTGGNRLELSIDAASCREAFAPTDEPYQLSVFIRTRPDIDFVPLFENMTIPRDDPNAIPELWDVCDAR